MDVFPNSSLERVRHGRLPRPPMSNADRLQQFRRRMSEVAQPVFNNFFIAGKSKELRASDAEI